VDTLLGPEGTRAVGRCFCGRPFSHQTVSGGLRVVGAGPG